MAKQVKQGEGLKKDSSKAMDSVDLEHNSHLISCMSTFPRN